MAICFPEYMNKAIVNIPVYFFFVHMSLFVLEEISEDEIAGSLSRCMFHCMRNCQIAFQNGYTFLPAICESSSCSTFLPTFGNVSVFNSNCLSGC